MEDLPAWVSIAGALSPAALIALFVLFIYSGALIPKRTLPILTEERDQRMRDLRMEADRWRQVSELRDQELSTLRDQVGMLLEQSEVTVVLLQAIKNQAG
jgi:hypothetical protein